jgi:hypothetical protein
MAKRSRYERQTGCALFSAGRFHGVHMRPRRRANSEAGARLLPLEVPRLVAAAGVGRQVRRKSMAGKSYSKTSRCWPGYEPVPGKGEHEEGSCRKKPASRNGGEPVERETARKKQAASGGERGRQAKAASPSGAERRSASRSKSKAPAKRSATKKSPAKKSSAKRSSAKKSSVKKSSAKKAADKKPAA